MLNSDFDLIQTRVRDGAPQHRYTGGTSADSIADYVKKMTGILTLEAIDCVAIDKYIEENKLALAYFGDFTGDLWEAYNELPKEESLANMYGFFHTIDTSCGEKYGVSGEGLMVHRSFDEPNVVYSGD